MSHYDHQGINTGGCFSSLQTRSRLYATWFLLKRRGQGPIAMRRADIGNRADTILIQESKVAEVPDGLDIVAAGLEQLAWKHADEANVIISKLWYICSNRNAASIHPNTVIKDGVEYDVSHFVAKAQQQYDKLGNPSDSSNLSNNIKMTLRQLYSNGILTRHTFAAKVDDVY
jgi:hypothetical protein